MVTCDLFCVGGSHIYFLTLSLQLGRQMTSVCSVRPTCPRYLNDVSGNALPTCSQYIKWRQWQCSSHVLTVHQMTSVAMLFPRAHRTSNDVSGNALPTCSQDVKLCQWQCSSHVLIVPQMMSVAMLFPRAHRTSNNVSLQCSSLLEFRLVSLSRMERIVLKKWRFPVRRTLSSRQLTP